MKTRLFILFVFALLVTIVPVFSADAPGVVNSPAVAKLLADYQRDHANALKTVNETYAAQADTAAKQYLSANDLATANKAGDFAKRLRDADENNDLDGIGGGPATDRLVIIQQNYARAREDVVRKVAQYYQGVAQNVQRTCMQSGDLAGANSVATFLEKIKPGVAPVSLDDAATKGRNLLSKDNEHKWIQEKGEWRFENGAMIGSGESWISFADPISTPFTLQFKINVLDGMRPRVKFGPIEFGNEGYNTVFALNPEKDTTKLFPYQRNVVYKVAIVASHKSVELFINDKSISVRPGLKDKTEKLTFSGGDGWSKGRVEYRDILVIK